MARATAATIEAGGRALLLRWGGGRSHTSRFAAAWLAHHATPAHRDPLSGQLLLSLPELGGLTGARLTAAALAGDGDAVALTFAGSAPRSNIVSLRWLAAHDTAPGCLQRQLEAATPPSSVSVPTFDCEQLLHGGDAQLLPWLQALNRHGAALVTRCGTAEGTVTQLAARIGHPMITIYGATWQVVSTTDPINLAYSNAALPLHSDLSYYESSPGLQLLHARVFDACVRGGGSVLMDGFAMADSFRAAHPSAFELLCRVPATFQKIHFRRAQPVHLVRQRPHFCVDSAFVRASGTPPVITAVHWAPPFEGPLHVPQEDVEPYYEAYGQLARFIHDAETSGAWTAKLRLAPGDCLVFNNRRMLHGREAIVEPPRGSSDAPRRLLQGCYVAVEEYTSRLMTLQTLASGPAAAAAPSGCRVGDHQALLR